MCVPCQALLLQAVGAYFHICFRRLEILRTGTTAARVLSIKTSSRLPCTLMPREGGAGSGFRLIHTNKQPNYGTYRPQQSPETTQVRSPVSLGVPVKSASEWRDGGWACGSYRPSDTQPEGRGRSGSLQHKPLGSLAPSEAVLRKLRDGLAVA